jgi:hypothetical protein
MRLTALLAILLAGCLNPSLPSWDGDGDGYGPTDCNDDDPNIAPLKPDALGDGVDQNCDGADGEDLDGDGFLANVAASDPRFDCDDRDDQTNPDAIEVADGIDNDCDGTPDEGTEAWDDDGDGHCEGVDLNGDGLLQCTCAGHTPGDCDDENDTAWPGAPEDCDDEVDSNCDEGDDLDEDADGFTICSGDCDDDAPLIFPGAHEVCDDVDDNCDGLTTDDNVDYDGDGFSPCDLPGDCDDTDIGASPATRERCDGLDTDCDPSSDAPGGEVDNDGDGYWGCEGDCDDADGGINPTAADRCGDALDQDCDGDADGSCVECTVELTDPGVDDLPAALAACPAVLCLGPGDWPGNIDLGGCATRIVGLDGAPATRIVGDGDGTVVRIDSGEGPDTILEGLTIIGGVASGADGGGISVAQSGPVLRRLIVRGNSAVTGGGIRLDDADVELSQCTVADNDASGFPFAGGGLYVSGGTVNVDRSTIRDNTTSIGIGGGGAFVGGASATVQTSLIEGNVAALDGGGLAFVEATADLSNLRILENRTGSAGTGGGLFFQDSAATLQHLLVAENSSLLEGAGINVVECLPPGVTLSHAMLLANTATNTGGAVRSKQGSLFDIEQATFVGNSASHGGAVMFNQTSTGSVRAVSATHNIATSATIRTDNFAMESGGELGWANVILNTPGNLGPLTDVDVVGDLLASDPGHDLSALDPTSWRLTLDPLSPLVDGGEPGVLDPDGSPADIGAFGGPGADGWDLDGDGFFAWWRPGPYDPSVDPLADCDDLDASITPEDGC